MSSGAQEARRPGVNLLRGNSWNAHLLSLEPMLFGYSKVYDSESETVPVTTPTPIQLYHPSPIKINRRIKMGTGAFQNKAQFLLPFRLNQLFLLSFSGFASIGGLAVLFKGIGFRMTSSSEVGTLGPICMLPNGLKDSKGVICWELSNIA